MRLGKRQANEVASMLSNLLNSLDRENDSLFGNEQDYTKRQIDHDTFSPDQRSQKISRQRQELYANMAKRGIITGSDSAYINTHPSRGEVVYHDWYFLSPTQLQEYLNHDAVNEVFLHDGELPHYGHRKTWDMVRKYIAGEGEIEHLNGHTPGSGFPARNTLGKK